jgi:hypothetical protein
MPDETVQASRRQLHVWIEEQEILGIHLGKHPVVSTSKTDIAPMRCHPNGVPKRPELGKSVVVARVVENDDLNRPRGGCEQLFEALPNHMTRPEGDDAHGERRAPLSQRARIAAMKNIYRSRTPT